MSEKQAKPTYRNIPSSQVFRDFIASGWADRSETPTAAAEVASYAAARRERLSAQFPGERIIIPAGGLKVRSNDTDYQFRPHTAFAWLTGLGADREPDAVLVLEPNDECGHDPIIYLRPLAGRDTEEFFADSRIGEFWVGARPSLDEVEAELGVGTRDIAQLGDGLGKDAGVISLRVVRDADAELSTAVDAIRAQVRAEGAEVEATVAAEAETDQELSRWLSTARMVKDDYEIDQMRRACTSTAEAFEAVVTQMPEAVSRGRGERWIEGVFGLHARHHGNGVGYDSICAAGDHANTLHWIKNTGDLVPGELLLLDAGVEVDALYTADVTRTLPISGRFTPAQRTVYDAVYAAQSAGIAACRPGATFKDVHAAAIRVVAEHLHQWGLLPEGIGVDDTLDPEGGQFHRRWMVHGTSHHLGLDVHDCQLALREDYTDGTLAPGMILTVEPGLYFKADDLLVPEEFRGIGVRIEDDILITDDGCENLSAALPRSADDVEAWMQRLLPR